MLIKHLQVQVVIRGFKKNVNNNKIFQFVAIDAKI